MIDEVSRILRRNEKIKSVSAVITNLGAALLAAAFGRWWLVGPDLWVTLWGILGCFVIFCGAQLLNGLEVES